MLAILLLTLAQSDPTKEPPRAEVRRLDLVLVWNNEALDAIRAAKTPPPHAARQLAILHAALFDAVNVVKPDHAPYFVKLRAVEDIDASAAVAACAAEILSAFHPRRAERFRKLRDAQTPDGPAAERGAKLGRYCAAHLLHHRKGDADTFKGEYRAPLAVGIWRPTPPARAAALLPDLGKMKPFAIKGHRFIAVAEPPELTSAEYAADFNEVKAVGSLRSKTRTADQTLIAKFWDDGAGTCTPPGHWNLVAHEASQARKLSLEENARLFALLNLALADAGVACWECKYKFRTWRPVTAIHEADRDANDATQRDPDWMPLLATPPFPTYTSGHSTFSGAAAAVLAGYFGTDEVAFKLRSDGVPGSLRDYKGFRAAALEAGKSRVYGGIHFEFDNREGLALGRAVGEEVLKSKLLPSAKTPAIR
ncbi:MAG: phosphatase PAP2 family protein [Gemmataceae bacterium]|nr:phosphatase PAP2 family protein [Gemmataceae bacterium]